MDKSIRFYSYKTKTRKCDEKCALRKNNWAKVVKFSRNHFHTVLIDSYLFLNDVIAINEHVYAGFPLTNIGLGTVKLLVDGTHRWGTFFKIKRNAHFIKLSGFHMANFTYIPV